MSRRDEERVARLCASLEHYRLDALFCTLPSNVLLLSGYWPVVGTAVAFFTKDGRSVVLAPRDEEEFARESWADEVRFFDPANLRQVNSVAEALQQPLAKLCTDLHILNARIGYESGPSNEPESYVASHLYGQEREALLKHAAPGSSLHGATRLLHGLKSILTQQELHRVRTACEVAKSAFADGAATLRAGLMESEAAAHFRTPLSVRGLHRHDVQRADGHVFCMSGVNSAKAYAAFQRSTSKPIAPGDLVLVHCNSYVDGFWTDITRTFLLANDSQQREQLLLVLQARDAALRAIKPGACASDVDEAARSVLADAGFGNQFKHSTGHGVGFEAINHNAPPRIHPESKDVLKEGMVFNVEPGLYFDGRYGMRHCDMVAVNSSGCELLTWQDRLEDLLLAPSPAA